MGFSDANTLLAGPKQPIAKFDRIGDFIEGVLVDAEVLDQTTPMGDPVIDERTGAVKKQIVYTLQTGQFDPEIEDDNGERRVFAKWAIQSAISDELRDKGLSKQGLEEGGLLRITYTESKPAKTRGFSPMKLYTAAYTPPVKKLATPAAQPASPWDAAPAQPALDVPVPAKADLSVKYPQAMIDLAFSIYSSQPGVDLAVISAATKISVEDLGQILAS